MVKLSISLSQIIMEPNLGSNGDKSAARFGHQVAAWVLVMFCKIYFVKNHKFANNSAMSEAKEKISTDLESLEPY